MTDLPTAKIILMPGVRKAPGDTTPVDPGCGPDAQLNCVELLEDLLAEAKRGEILALSIGIVHSDGSPGDVWAVGENSPTGTGHMLIAATAYLAHRVVSVAVEPVSAEAKK